MATFVATLRECETLASQLIAAQGRLVGEAMNTESTLGLSAVTSQTVLGCFSDAQRGTVEVRGHLVAGHRHLERLGRIFGFDDSMFGDAGKEPRGALGAPVQPVDPISA